MTRAFVFPGQGSQAVGMGKELADAFSVARDVFGEVDEALSQNLTKIMFEDPNDELILTENAQPALMAVSLAVSRILESEGGFKLADHCTMVAGHSLGEYSALAAMGAFSLGDTARLLKIRGKAMQAAVPVGQGAMAACLGLSMEDAQSVAEEAAQGDEVCTAANDNAPGQVVLSGSKAAIDRALPLAKEKGAKRSVLLPVSAPFHCSLMQPAADAMAEALGNVEIQAPRVQLIANVSAQSVSNPDDIRKLLVEQVCGSVRWRESVLFMKEQGVEQLVELGTGKVLSGLARRIDRSLKGVAINNPADIETFLATL